MITKGISDFTINLFITRVKNDVNDIIKTTIIKKINTIQECTRNK